MNRRGRTRAPAAGRPRSAEADRSILRATVDLLCEAGVEGTSIEAVAERAGVSRPTVYRRYPDRDRLIEAAVEDCFERDVARVEPSDDPLRDVIDLLESTIDMLQRTPIGPLLRAAVPHLARHGALRRLAHDLGRRRRRRLLEALERAIAQGAFATDADLEVLTDGVLGAIYFRYLVTRRKLDRGYAETLWETLA